MKQNGQRFHPKTTFKRILCPDHAVCVLRYITCRDGQRTTRKNGDGLQGANSQINKWSNNQISN